MSVATRGHLPNAARSLCALALLLSLAGTCWLMVPYASAAEPTTTVAIGESNDELERAELLDLFGVADSDAVIDITVDETLRAWEGIFDLSGVDSAYSSVALTCNASRPGVDVTTSNIEVIPPDLYALALVTAGLTDAKLVVAAPDDAPALGMTALTGIFKAWDQSPCASAGSDPARRQLALQQLALVAGIGQAHGGVEAVGTATDLVLSLQQAAVGGQMDPDGIGAMVTSRSEWLGFPLTSDEQGSVVDFFDLLLNEQPDWGGFADTWRVDHISNGTRVMMRPGDMNRPSLAPRIVATGVGGPIGAIPTTPPTLAATAQMPVTPVPTTTPRILVIPSPTATETAPVAGVAGVAGPTGTGGPSAGGSNDGPFPWWIVIGLIPLALGAVLLARRRRRPLLIVRRVSPIVAAAAVAQRRAATAENPVAAPPAETTGKVLSRRRFTVVGRRERPVSVARVTRRVIGPSTPGD